MTGYKWKSFFSNEKHFTHSPYHPCPSSIKIIASAFILLLAICVHGSVISINPNKGFGYLESSMPFRVIHYGLSKYTSQWHKSFTATTEKKRNITITKGEWGFPEIKTPVNVDFSATITDNGTTGIFRYRLEAKEPVPTKALALQFELKRTEMVGKRIYFNNKSYLSLPEKFSTHFFGAGHNVNNIALPLREGILTINPSFPIEVKLWDQPKKDLFTLRLYFLPPEAKSFIKTDLSLSMKFTPYKTTPILLNSAANSSFRDKAPNDRKGGWTDEGSEKDLRMIKPGSLTYSWANFNIIDAAANNGKDCIVLGGQRKPHLPGQTTLEFPNPVSMKTLILLHSTAWTGPGGKQEIVVKYKNGTIKKIPVVCGRDVGEWWGGTPIFNGEIGWAYRDDKSERALYVSCFPINDEAVSSISFVNSGKSIWMIAGAAYSNMPVYTRRQQKYTVMRNADWRAFNYDRNIATGSALDFSFLLDAPAGKYGYIYTKNGEFFFDNNPGPQRFYGTNVCGRACFLEHNQAEELADRLSKIGYNAVRLHHIDRDLISKGGKDSTSLDLDQLDRIEYLISCLKKRGIYITIDLFSFRANALKKKEFKSAPELKSNNTYKLAAMLMPEINQNFKEYARELLTRSNKYTGLSLAKEPALIGICGLNENMITSLYESCGRSSDAKSVMNYYNQCFDQYCKSNTIKVNSENRQEFLHRFLYDTYKNYQKDMADFLKKLGVKAPFTELNHLQPPRAYSLREKLDYVDNHIYWDHPRFTGENKWQPPYQVSNKSIIKGNLHFVTTQGPVRIFGKPFTITEFNSCYPNEYRGEGAAIFGAYASLQNWGAIYRFDYGMTPEALFGTPFLNSFDTANDPIRLLSERIGMAFFTRGDVKTASQAVPVELDPNNFTGNDENNYPEDVQKLTLLLRTGSISSRANTPAGTIGIYQPNQPLPASLKDILKKEKDTVTSLTGEIVTDIKKGFFKAVTASSEAMVIPEKQKLNGKHLTVRAIKGFQVAAIIAIDNKPIAQSSRLLLLHLSDVKAEGTQFASRDCRVLLKYPPNNSALLAKQCIGEFELSLPNGKYKINALDINGQKRGNITYDYSGGKLRFTANTFSIPEKVVFAYELIRYKQ